MADWHARYEKGFTAPESEKNYLLKTINDFVELSIEEHEKLKEIMKELKNEHARET